MKRDLYFKELAVVLGRAGFTPLPQEDDSLPVEYHSQRLCRINEQGNVFYRQEEVDSPEREKACAKATDIAGTVLEYMNHLEHAPTLKAAGLWTWLRKIPAIWLPGLRRKSMQKS